MKSDFLNFLKGLPLAFSFSKTSISIQFLSIPLYLFPSVENNFVNNSRHYLKQIKEGAIKGTLIQI